MIFAKFRFARISWRLTIIYAAIFAMILIILNAAVLNGVSFFLHQQAIHQLNDVTELITARISKSRHTMKDLVDEDLVLEIPSNDNIYVKIITPAGRVINESAKFNLKIPEQIPINARKHAVLKKHLLYKNQAVVFREKIVAYLQVVKDFRNAKHFLRVLFLLMVGADLLGIVSALLAGVYISKKVLRPISQITETAQIISIHDLNKRIPIQGPNDELSNLAQTFNEMIERLQQSFVQQNQFVSDASHELRTPIAVIRGYVDLLDRWGKEERAILEEAIRAIKNETAGMTDLIEKLLFLARGDNELDQSQIETFSLDELITELLKETRMVVTDLAIVSERNEPQAVDADRKLIKQMIRTLLDNSIKFTPAGGRITLNSLAEKGCAKITVKDTGIGIPAVDLPHIFNRFYQVDKARQSTRGSGLGLAIAKRIVDLHNGAVEVTSQEGTGTEITVYLPPAALDSPVILS